MGKPGDQIGVVTALVRAAFLVNAAYSENGREFGLTPQQGQVLCVLRSSSFGVVALAGALGLAKSTTSGLLDVLERNGLVSREAGPDARSVTVVLTPHGRSVADGFYEQTSLSIRNQLRTLDDAERETVARLIGRVTDDNEISMIFPDA